MIGKGSGFSHIDSNQATAVQLLDAHYQNNKNSRKAFDPLPPEELNKAQGKLNQTNFNWLFISVWLGLRPQEIDNLHAEDLWRIETPIVGRKIF